MWLMGLIKDEDTKTWYTVVIKALNDLNNNTENLSSVVVDFVCTDKKRLCNLLEYMVNNAQGSHCTALIEVGKNTLISLPSKEIKELVDLAYEKGKKNACNCSVPYRKSLLRQKMRV